MHPRAQIRNAFADRLKEQIDGKFRTSAQDRVYKNQLFPIDTNDDDELPAILVYARVDKRDPEKDYPADGTLSHAESTLHLVTTGGVRGGKTVDDDLDDLAEQIEAALDDWDVPGFESAKVRLAETEIDVITENVKRPVGVVDLVWIIKYRRPWRGEKSRMRDDIQKIMFPDDGGTP